MNRQLVNVRESRRYRRRGPRLKWLILDALAWPRERAIQNELLRDFREAVERGDAYLIGEPYVPVQPDDEGHA